MNSAANVLLHAASEFLRVSNEGDKDYVRERTAAIAAIQTVGIYAAKVAPNNLAEAYLKLGQIQRLIDHQENYREAEALKNILDSTVQNVTQQLNALPNRDEALKAALSRLVTQFKSTPNDKDLATALIFGVNMADQRDFGSISMFLNNHLADIPEARIVIMHVCKKIIELYQASKDIEGLLDAVGTLNRLGAKDIAIESLQASAEASTDLEHKTRIVHSLLSIDAVSEAEEMANTMLQNTAINFYSCVDLSFQFMMHGTEDAKRIGNRILKEALQRTDAKGLDVINFRAEMINVDNVRTTYESFDADIVAKIKSIAFSQCNNIANNPATVVDELLKTATDLIQLNAIDDAINAYKKVAGREDVPHAMLMNVVDKFIEYKAINEAKEASKIVAASTGLTLLDLKTIAGKLTTLGFGKNDLIEIYHIAGNSKYRDITFVQTIVNFLLDLGANDKALGIYKNFVAQPNVSESTMYYAAQAFEKLGAKKEAIEAYTQSISFHVDINNICRSLIRLNAKAEALAAIKSSFANGDALIALQEHGTEEDIMDAYERAIKKAGYLDGYLGVSLAKDLLERNESRGIMALNRLATVSDNNERVKKNATNELERLAKEKNTTVESLIRSSEAPVLQAKAP